MKCDLCDREFNNSEELMQHKEQMHPMNDAEMPEMGAEKQEMPESEREPAERRR